jgi:uncharacterized membrane protein
LKDFDLVVPNGAERIMQAWEAESAHRRKIESDELAIIGWDAKAGKILALVFVCVALGSSLYAAVNGAEIFASILGGGTIASVVWVFVQSTGLDRSAK